MKMNYDSDECRSEYPVFLVHGTGFRDRKLFNYWGSIPRLLKKRGTSVFYSKHDAWSNMENSAGQILIQLEKALSESGKEKVNIIAHSKGGVDVRYAIKKFNLESKVASLTLISSPNHGSKTMDVLFSVLGEGFFRFCAVFVNFWFRLLGDKNPDFFRAICQFRFSYMEKINHDLSDCFVFPVQSFAGKMKSPFSDVFMGFLNCIVKINDGDNDGLVSVDSAKYGNFRGMLEGRGFFGISHPDEVDGYRTNPKLRQHDGLPENSRTIREFYINLVKEFKEKGL